MPSLIIYKLVISNLCFINVRIRQARISIMPPIHCIRAITNFTKSYQHHQWFHVKFFMKCNLPKFITYQLRLGKLPMMDLYEIYPRIFCIWNVDGIGPRIVVFMHLLLYILKTFSDILVVNGFLQFPMQRKVPLILIYK